MEGYPNSTDERHFEDCGNRLRQINQDENDDLDRFFQEMATVDLYSVFNRLYSHAKYQMKVKLDNQEAMKKR